MLCVRQEVSLEEVERLTEDSAEAKEYEERMRTLLGEALTAEDDAAVLQELSQLEKAEASEEAAQLPEVPKVGSADSAVFACITFPAGGQCEILPVLA